MMLQRFFVTLAMFLMCFGTNGLQAAGPRVLIVVGPSKHPPS